MTKINLLLIRWLGILSIIFVSVTLSDCTSNRQGNGISQEYLNSSSYQEYKNRVQEEKKHRKASKINFRKRIYAFARQFVGEPNRIKAIPELSVDSTLKNKQMVAWLNSRKDWRRLNLNNKYLVYHDYFYKPVGKWQLTNGLMLFFLFKKRRSSLHGLLMMVSVKQDNIADIKAIASYRKGIDSRVESNVFFQSPQNIIVKVSKTIFYPFSQAEEYHNNYKKRYKIIENGRILSHHAHRGW